MDLTKTDILQFKIFHLVNSLGQTTGVYMIERSESHTFLSRLSATDGLDHETCHYCKVRTISKQDISQQNNERVLRDLGDKEISSPEGVNYYLGVIKVLIIGQGMGSKQGNSPRTKASMCVGQSRMAQEKNLLGLEGVSTSTKP